MTEWFTEEDEGNLRFSYALKDVLYRGQSPFQKIEILESHAYGRMMVLDDFVMLTQQDEFVYHEMIAHIPMAYHPSPRKVLVIGGGDGGTVRELVRYP